MHLPIKTLISYYHNNRQFISIDLYKAALEDMTFTCQCLCVLMLFKNTTGCTAPDVTIFLDHILTFDSFSNWLKINYKGFYGWQKVQQVFLDNCSNFPSDIVQKIQSLSLPSTFEIPSNWIIYAPISR